MLTWVDGEQFSWYADDDLAASGDLVRELHDATAGFAAPAGALWQRMVGAPADGPVICHNDLSPDNAIRTPSGLVLVDWDLAAPGTRVWDVAWAAYRWVPLYDDATCARLDIPVPDRGRLRLLVDAYGLDAADRAAWFRPSRRVSSASSRPHGPGAPRAGPVGSMSGATLAAASGGPGWPTCVASAGAWAQALR